MNNSIKEYIKESIETKQKILTDEKLVSKIDDVATKIIEVYRVNQKVLVAGNGGSAADAQHIVAELVSKFSMDRPALNALALTTNTSILTAVGNDYNHDYIFSLLIFLVVIVYLCYLSSFQITLFLFLLNNA